MQHHLTQQYDQNQTNSNKDGGNAKGPANDKAVQQIAGQKTANTLVEDIKL